MSKLNFDLNFLAQETLELTKNLRNSQNILKNEHEFDRQLDLIFDERPFHFDEEEIQEEDIQEEGIQEEAKVEVPESCGILYVVEKGISTFCIRGLLSDDLSWDYEAIKRNDPQMVKSLRLKEDWSMEDIAYFPTPNLELAETIFDQMINRRFPRNEAVLCNLSDPGFSWWLSEKSNSIEIFFQSHGIERDSSLIQLGPLGDPLISFKRFSRGHGILRQLFSINEFSATEKAFALSTNVPNDEFYAFKSLFTAGRFEFQEILEAIDGEEQVFFLYLREVAFLRAFWLCIQQVL